MRRTSVIPVAVAALALLATAFAPAANAAPEEEVATGLISPLSLAVTPDGTVYVSQNFAGTLTKVAAGEEPAEVYSAPAEVGAVSVEGDVVTFATTGGTHKNPTAAVYTKDGDADPTRLANVYKYEKANNPDGDVRYGFVGLTRACRQKTEGPDAYKGIVESHPYATNVDGDGVTYLADAAGNSILAITDAGAISTVAVLPVNKLKITRKFRRGYNEQVPRSRRLPKCYVGGTWRAEPVPTDVEMGPDGNLYVTSLPGGHETNGSVFQVSPTSGAITKVMSGLVGPTGLAIAPNGTAYVASLFTGMILQKPLGEDPSVFAEVPFPGDVEVVAGHVYATETDLTNDGSSPPAGRVLRWSTAP